MNLILKKHAHTPLLTFIRFGSRIRGKPPGVAKTLAQRLADENYEDPELNKRVDIGFPLLRPSRSEELKQRLEHVKGLRKDGNLEKLARNKKLEIDLDETKALWLKTAGPFQIRKIADHYGVFEHLFGKYAFFTPRVSLDIKFEQQDDSSVPVYHGNRVKPSEAQKAPEVSFNHEFSMTGGKPEKSTLWTLTLTNPDGNLKDQDKECVHWMIGNIPDGNVSKGELIVPYLQPFPPKGTGYHRFVFVLYKQEAKLNFSELQTKDPANLSERSFSTFDFYRKHQDEITPVGLSFFQSNWDETLTKFFHEKLNMKEPLFDYDYPEAFLKNEVAFPHRAAFNLYMDRYADPKDVNKRFLEEKLSKTHPFEGPETAMQFPNAHYFGNEPSWLKTEIKKKRLMLGRVNDVSE